MIRALAFVACLALAAPAAALVGGADVANGALTRHVVMVVGGVPAAAAPPSPATSCSRRRIAWCPMRVRR
jgi:hypothetical protein